VVTVGCRRSGVFLGAVLVRYRYRLYPSPGQRQALAQVFGCARVVYNDCLRLREECHAAGKKISDAGVQRRAVTLAKLTPERAWLAEVPSVALLQACNDARRAYRNWFDSLSGHRKGRQVGSANRAKARHRVAVVHRKERDTRRDHAHKIALRLIRDNQAVYAEDLAVSGLARTRLAKSVHDAGWSQLLRLLADKAEYYGRGFYRVGQFVPTSQICSACGTKDGPKPLSVQAWTCAVCGAVHDRDVNAARNILAAGRAERLNACGGDVRPSPAVAVPVEAGTHRGAA
jgi:transposase